MFKNLMNGVSLSAMMLRDADDEAGSAKARLREQIAKGNLPEGQKETKEADDGKNPDDKSDNKDSDDGEDEEEGDDDESEEGEEEGQEDNDKVEETEEQKAEREKQERIAAKAQRKQDRMQRRIDDAIAAKNAANVEIERLKAQLEANPDQKLTAEEVEAKAEAKAAEKLAAKQLEEVQEKFKKACDALQKDARKHDKEFDDKINDIASDIGPIPSFMIGVLEDLDNGGEVLAFIANDDELAEKIWDLKGKPAKMTTEIVKISNKLLDAKKKPKKEISKVPDPPEPVKGSRNSQSTVITEADTKNMESYVAKRMRQIEERRKMGR